MVIVSEIAISLDPVSGAAQLPQKRVSAGFSNWHFGHLVATAVAFCWLGREYQGTAQIVNQKQTSPLPLSRVDRTGYRIA
jgi:hypothetical protein